MLTDGFSREGGATPGFSNFWGSPRGRPPHDLAMSAAQLRSRELESFSNCATSSTARARPPFRGYARASGEDSPPLSGTLTTPQKRDYGLLRLPTQAPGLRTHTHGVANIFATLISGITRSYGLRTDFARQSSLLGKIRISQRRGMIARSGLGLRLCFSHHELGRM